LWRTAARSSCCGDGVASARRRSAPRPSARNHMKTRTVGVQAPIDLVEWDVVGNPVVVSTVIAFHRLNAPVCRLLDQVLPLAATLVTGIQPEQLHSWQPRADGVTRDEFDPIPVHFVGGMDVDGLRHPSCGIPPAASLRCLPRYAACATQGSWRHRSRAPRPRWRS
jgi:hypothetical protein